MIFFLFHIEIEGKCGWIIGGAKGYVAPPPLKLLGGPAPPPPPPAPPPPLSCYAYEHSPAYLMMLKFCKFKVSKVTANRRDATSGVELLFLP